MRPRAQAPPTYNWSMDGPPLKLPLHWIMLPPPVHYGMNPLRLYSVADEARDSDASHRIGPPILVQKLGYECYRLVEGRHRYLGSYVAGRQDIDAYEVEGGTGQCSSQSHQSHSPSAASSATSPGPATSASPEGATTSEAGTTAKAAGPSETG